MHEYDATLKLLLQAAADSVLKQLSGLTVERWLNDEMQQVQVSRVDLLADTSSGQILHTELQATNDPNMALRMAEYALRTYRKYGKFPKQIVIYVGEARMNMKDSLQFAESGKPALTFSFTLIDFRDLDGAVLLASNCLEDNLLSILAGQLDAQAAIRQMLSHIAVMEEPARRTALAQFLILSGLRRLGPVIREEARKMPITLSILDHDLLGPAILQGRQEGRQEIITEILTKRFGRMPDWVEKRISGLAPDDLKSLAERVINAKSLEDLSPS